MEEMMFLLYFRWEIIIDGDGSVFKVFVNFVMDGGFGFICFGIDD